MKDSDEDYGPGSDTKLYLLMRLQFQSSEEYRTTFSLPFLPDPLLARVEVTLNRLENYEHRIGTVETLFVCAN